MTMGKKLRVGIIGAGMIAQSGHIPAYRRFPDSIEIVAICGPHAESVKAVAEKYSIGKWFLSAQEMLDSCDLDIVSICTPNARHVADAALALSCGVNVLCEKPLALTEKDAAGLFAMARARGLMLAACQTLRFNPEYMAAREAVLAGDLGKVHFGACTCVRRRGAPKRGAFLSTELNGGGAMADIGVHFLDAILWMMGNPRVVSVSGSSSNGILLREKEVRYDAKESGSYDSSVSLNPTVTEVCDVEDFASGVIRLEGDASVQFCIAWNANMPAMRSIRILGDYSGLELPKLSYYGSVTDPLEDRTPAVAPLTGYADMPFPGHCYLVQNVIDHLTCGAPLLIQPEETVNVTAALELFYRSCEARREVFRKEA